MNIAVFYHCLFFIGTPPRLIPNSLAIVHEQMWMVKESGLLDACSEFVVGCNGGQESLDIAKRIFPEKAKIVLNGLDSHSENLTLVELEKWAPKHPNHAVLYFHSKGATHTPGTEYYKFISKWRNGMMQDLVSNWQRCVDDLSRNDIACSLWMWNMADGTQHIPAGNFLWVKSDFVSRLPSIFNRSRIKMSGISSIESRFEAEVYWGNGKLPNVKQYHPEWQVWKHTL